MQACNWSNMNVYEIVFQLMYPQQDDGLGRPPIFPNGQMNDFHRLLYLRICNAKMDSVNLLLSPIFHIVSQNIF